jgi:hypothetical protein
VVDGLVVHTPSGQLCSPPKPPFICLPVLSLAALDPTSGFGRVPFYQYSKAKPFHVVWRGRRTGVFTNGVILLPAWPAKSMLFVRVFGVWRRLI